MSDTLKIILLILFVLALVLFAWSDEIHEAALKGDLESAKGIVEKNQGAHTSPVRFPFLDSFISCESCPTAIPDGKHLSFNSNRGGDIHTWWVDAGFIEKLRSGIMKNH